MTLSSPQGPKKPSMMKSLLPVGLLALPATLTIFGCTTTSTDGSLEGSDGGASVEAGEFAPPNLSESNSAQDPVQEAQDVADIREQKTQLMVADLVSKAREAYADARLTEAENYLLNALRLDPSSHDAQRTLEEVWLAMGKPITPISGESEDAAVRLQARVDRIKADTQAHAERGFELLNDGELAEAIGALRLAQANIRGIRYQTDWGDLPNRVDGALAQAESNLEVDLASRREEERRRTYDQLREEEELRKAQKQARLDRMFNASVTAFEDEDFDLAIELTDSILRVDPLNEQVAELRDSAYRARYEAVNRNFVKERAQRFRLWVQENEEAKVLTSEIIQPTDIDRWLKITELRAHYRDLGLSAEVDPNNVVVMRKVMEEKVAGLNFDGETSLETVIDQLRAQTDIPFVVTPDAIDAVDAEGVEYTFNLNNAVTVQDALQVITDASGPEVTYTFKYGVVYITSKEKAQGQKEVKAHDVQDLTAQPVDFSGPKIDEIRLPDSVSSFDEEEPAFGGVVGEPTPIMDPDNLETLITQSIEPDSWDDATIRYSNGFLIVVHTAEVQRKVDAFLQDLRRYISSMVTIEARFLTIQKDYLQEIGVDFRGLGGVFSPPTSLVNLDDLTSGLEDNSSLGLDNEGPGLPDGAETNPSAGAFYNEGGDGDIRARTENILGPYGERLGAGGGLTMQFVFLDDTQTSLILRAVEKSNRAQELMSTTLSAQNTQRAYITVLNQITYVQDMDVEVAQAALIADPQVGVVSDGIVLDVRPTISHDRRYITLELRPTVATLLRPIPEFTSSLAGLTTPVTLQLPELQVSSANTTVVVPDGGTVVVGGLKKLLNIEQRAEVPFLAKIPILSILFKAEGEASETQDVIILIRAHITDAREVMNSLESAATVGTN